MSAKVFDKFMGILGLEDEVEEVEETQEEVINDNVVRKPMFSQSNKHNSKVVNIHAASTAKIVIVKPKTYDEAIDICDNLKNRRIVVINMCDLEPRIAQKLLDFMAGASYALGGNLEEVEKEVYIVSPSNIEVNNEFKNQLSSKNSFFK